MTKTNVPIELTDNDSSISIDPTEHLNNVNVETLNFGNLIILIKSKTSFIY